MYIVTTTKLWTNPTYLLELSPFVCSPTSLEFVVFCFDFPTPQNYVIVKSDVFETEIEEIWANLNKY